MHLAFNIDSDDKFEREPDDFDFYRLQQDDLLAGRSSAAAKSLPSDGIDFSASSESETSESGNDSEEESGQREQPRQHDSDDDQSSSDCEMQF